MKPLRLSLTLLVAVLVAIPVLMASAQTPSPQAPSTGAIPNIDEFEGIEAAVSRTWGRDVAALIAATPDIEPDDLGDGLTALSAIVLRFDNEEHARTAYDAFLEGIDVDLRDLAQGGTPTVTGEPLSDLGDTATAVTLNTRTDEQETFYRIVLVRDGEYFFVASALADTSENAAVADRLAQYLVDEGEEQGDEAIFVAEGASSGGLWGFMPADDHELLGGLIPIFDETLFPAP